VLGIILSAIEAGKPYQARVVAFTSADRGMQNTFKPFFSQELSPSMAPEDVDFKRLTSSSVNVTWKPLTLVEARGFPLYTVTLVPPPSSGGRNKRQQMLSQTTTNSFAVFIGLSSDTSYSTTVVVQTGNNSGMLTSPKASETFIGIVIFSVTNIS